MLKGYFVCPVETTCFSRRGVRSNFGSKCEVSYMNTLKMLQFISLLQKAKNFQHRYRVKMSSPASKPFIASAGVNRSPTQCKQLDSFSQACCQSGRARG